MRKQISLNGIWQLAEGQAAPSPTSFDKTAPVPGMVDMATPSLSHVGVESSERSHYWYRLEFATPHDAFQIATLRFRKTRYGMAAWLNGEPIGEQLYNFSFSEFSITEALNAPGNSNELLVRIGAHPTILPDHIVWGHDFEKIKYIPGIYDDVSLILSGAPRIENLQVAPDIDASSITVQTEIRAEDLATGPVDLNYEVAESGSGTVVASGTYKVSDTQKLATIEIPNFKTWSPESPFLYEIAVSSKGDSFNTRFGMRKFRFNPETGYAELNNQTYFLRGTNICMDRFNEDSQRGSKPWDKEWASRLLERIKEMNWNSFRFCLGFPPEFWYELCDEMGILVQDEYPIWYGAKAEDYPDALKGEHLAKEYAAWMRERWNHPCIVIWDAQNESVTEETGKAIRLVRDLDLSDRPWDNGYSPPDRETDPVETHPYVLQNFLGRDPHPRGPLFEFLTEKRIPDNGPSELFPSESGKRYPNPIQNNENVFFWITRGGQPTELTKWIFKRLYGEGEKSPDFYYKTYSYFFNRIITYWRCYRTSATVQEFAILSHSRELDEGGSYTSDHWGDLEKLEYHSHFENYCYSAFYPIGLLIDRWEDWHRSNTEVPITLKLINDRPQSWQGVIKYSLHKENAPQEEQFSSKSLSVEIPDRGTSEYSISMTAPTEEGAFVLVASFSDQDETIRQEYRFAVDDHQEEASFEAGESNEQYIHSEDESIMR
ncbi:glycoside hydrolase family 2 protein [Pelagicoccus mobilis]|uniref:Beta-galactosidase n=1 Tax=Pelagicoccus mobilis TaxID=415221 RepID=A0A934VSQ1_9BACT|nr:glycoside hydrolase family 2 TIM barrel-domain containing protein [Pelagicoccus mobilis]MBK1878734.1 hypothetical protein [Pelagicoccus mobilis]